LKIPGDSDEFWRLLRLVFLRVSTGTCTYKRNPEDKSSPFLLSARLLDGGARQGESSSSVIFEYVNAAAL
jgi:hypothetical protein